MFLRKSSSWTQTNKWGKSLLNIYGKKNARQRGQLHVAELECVLLPKYRQESYVTERDYREWTKQVKKGERHAEAGPTHLKEDEISGFCATCDGKSRGITWSISHWKLSRETTYCKIKSSRKENKLQVYSYSLAIYRLYLPSRDGIAW